MKRKRKRCIAHRITGLFLGMILIVLFLNGAVSLGSLRYMKEISEESSLRLGKTAARNAEAALECAAREQLLTTSVGKAADIQEKFLTIESYVKGMARAAEEIYAHPDDYPDRQVNYPVPHSTILAPQLLYSGRMDLTSGRNRKEAAKLGNIQDLLVQYNANNDMVSSTYIATCSGWVIQADYIAYTKYLPDGTLDYLEAEERQWYQRALRAERGERVYSDVIKDVHGGGECIVCAQPVYCEGRIMAVAGAGSYLQSVNEVVLHTSVGGKGYAFLVDEKGRVMFSPEIPGEISACVGKNRDLRESDNPVLAGLAKKMVLGEKGVEKLILDGREVYLAYAPLERPEWSFVTVMYVEDVIAPAVKSQQQILALTESANQQQKAAIGRTFFAFAVLMLLMGFVFCTLGMAETGKLTRPLLRLTEDVKKIGGGDLDYRIYLHTGDEIEDLGHAFNSMAEQIQKYIAHLAEVTAKEERIRTELSVAAKMQKDMLPKTGEILSDYREFTLAASMAPAKEVGGDFYDFFPLDGNRLALIVADVSGKGVPAALFMVIAKALLQSCIAREKSLERAMKLANESLCANNKNGMFVTVWAGILNISDGTLTYVNAGHCRPLLRRRNGLCEYLTKRGGFLLAGMEGVEFHQSVIRMEPGDVLFQYTDGITEADNEEGILYGESRLRSMVERAGGEKPEQVLATVREELRTFQGKREQSDDITMLVLCYNGVGKEETAFRFGADRRHMREASEWLSECLKKRGISGKSYTGLMMAADEVLSNICKYSNAKTVEIFCEFEDRRAEIVFEDDGIPYNPLEQSDPDVTLSLEERSVGGLGIYLLRKTADEVAYEYVRGKNRLKTVKLHHV